ncbi:DUF998 domain-containing protein [Pseudonocardia sp. KRD-291]|nr:DUF998 domain-containing protein [Pseudonocardia sp. KRD291]
MAWFGLELLLGGDRLGLAQRVLVVAQTVWPMVVAVALFRNRTSPEGVEYRPAARVQPGMDAPGMDEPGMDDRRTVPGDGAHDGYLRRSTGRLRPVSAAACWVVILGPVLVPVGSWLAAAVQPPGYDPVRQSLSTLGRLGATDRWIMTGTLVLLGLGYVAGALALTGAPLRGRIALGLGGAGTMFAGLLPQPETGSSAWHMGAATLGWVAFVCWPLAASRHPSASPLLGRRAAWAVTGVLLVLLGWFFVQLRTGGSHIGLSERLLILAQTLWPAVVVAALRRETVRRAAGTVALDHGRTSVDAARAD